MSLSNFGPGSASNEANGDDRRERAVQESPRESAPVTSAHLGAIRWATTGRATCEPGHPSAVINKSIPGPATTATWIGHRR